MSGSPPPPPPRRRTKLYLTAVVILLVLTAVPGYLLYGWKERPDPVPPPVATGRCGNLTETDKGECVGIIEDTRFLHRDLHSVVNKIIDHNKEVESSGQYVKVALLTPLSVAGGTYHSAMSLDQVRYSLEGTLTALHRANNTEDFGDRVVRIRLVLVNYGSRQDHSEKVVDAILAAHEPAHPLVAVVGLGSSFRGTEDTARMLSNKGIPMVSAVASSNSLAGEVFPTLYSVSPSNSDYALALRNFLDKHGSRLRLTDGIVVYDDNDDPYVRTLRESFNAVLKRYVTRGELPFTGGTVDTPARPREFDELVTNLCHEQLAPGQPKLRMVFYAGRVTDFEAFAKALTATTRAPSCKKDPLAILVGATGFQAAERYQEVLKLANITVIYASSADPLRWIRGELHTPEGFRAFYESFRQLGFRDPNGSLDPASSLRDGYAIMYHDAMAAAARAIRLAPRGHTVPGPADVNLMFRHLRSAYPVRAASGTLVFTRPDGRPSGKPVVCRQVGPTDAYQLPPNLEPYFMK